MIGRPLALAHALLLAIGLVTAAGAEEPVTVFAAASLSDAMETVARIAEERTGVGVRFSFASSSTLARQIEAGAAADIFISANQDWMDHLERQQLIEPGTRATMIGNRLVLIAPRRAAGAREREPFEVGPRTDLPGLLGEDERLALGDPEHVPAGIYAREALRSLGLWEALAPRLALAEDVRAALAHVARGEAPLGIVYATDARVTDGVAVIGMFPGGSHAPITYPIAIVGGRARPAVRAVYEVLTGPEARQVYERAGFTLR